MTQKQQLRPAVLITGASSGIGKACAIHLNNLGYQVIAGVRQKKDSKIIQEETTGQIFPVIIDVTDIASIESAENEVRKHLGEQGLSVLVNNAGTVSTGPLEFLPIEELRHQIEVNTIGQISITQAFLPQLRIGRGRIVNVGSDYGKVSAPFLGAYCASKFALEALTDALRMELSPWGIKVVIVQPGVISTPIWKRSILKANQIFEKLPKAAKALYRSDIEAVCNAASKIDKQGLSPEVVASTIAKIITMKRPKARYTIGLDAKLNILLSKLLPERILDRIIISYLGISKNNREITPQQTEFVETNAEP